MLPALAPDIDRAVALASRAGVDNRVLRVERRGDRVVVELPGHVVWLAGSASTITQLALERRVLSALADRLPVAIPVPVAHEGRACLRTKVIGQSGLEHHGRVMTDPRIAAAFAVELGRLFAAVHTALGADDLRRLIEYGLPTTAVLDWPDIVRGAASLEGQRSRRAQALIEAHQMDRIADADRTFLHGDLGSHNLVVDGDGRIIGLFDFEESCHGDRHHEFRWMPSDGRAFLERAMGVYCDLTGATVDLRRVRRAHALAALSQLGWGLNDPDEHDRRTGRTLAGTRAWAERAVDEA